MLQLKDISRVLARALHGGPVVVSLLSQKGLPLATVALPGAPDGLGDRIKVQSLLAMNAFQQQRETAPELADWAVVDLDGIKAAVLRFRPSDSAMYVVLFYQGADAVAKQKLDAVTAALASGLEGYVPT